MAKYSKEESDALVTIYEACPTQATVENLAQQFDVPVRSIIAKLSSLGVYARKKYLNKSGELPVKKVALADNLGKLLQLHDFEIEQLEKLSKPLLVKLTEIYNARI